MEKEAASEATGSTCQEDQDGNTADRSNAEQNTHLSSEKPTHVGAEEGNAEPPYLFECKIWFDIWVLIIVSAFSRDCRDSYVCAI